MSPTAPSLADLLNFGLVKQALENLVSAYGTPASGPIGALFVSFFLITILWVWVKNRFDTWSLWDVFLRTFIAAAGLVSWNSVFWLVDGAAGHTASLFGNINPNETIANILITPYYTSFESLMGSAVLILTPFATLIQLALFLTVEAVYNLNLLGAYFTTLLLYLLGPFFLAFYVFEPLQDLWMKYVRFYLTVKVWVLVQNVFLYMIETALAGNVSTLAGQLAAPLLSISYLFFLLIGLAACFPIARALTGGAAQALGSGSFVPGMVGAGVVAGATVAGMAVGSAAGPAGTIAGGTAGASAGGLGRKVITPNREA